MTGRALRIVIAPDSFKGSCTAEEAAAAMAEGARAVFGADVEIREMPLADGGEGTLAALTSAWGGRILTTPTCDAHGRERIGRIGLSGDGARPASEPVRAVIETAEANGLPHVADLPMAALDADTFGVGLLVSAALDAGARDLLLCLGGSATSDGGSGLLRALGARLVDADGTEIAPGARGLTRLARVDLTDVDPRAFAARWRVACDVESPLTGPRGAAAEFGPQKGATAEEIPMIDAGLARLAAVLDAEVDLTGIPGMGAAGGLALGPVALFGATLTQGAALVADATGLAGELATADLVLTGEGRLDASSLDGKVLSELLRHRRSPIAVIAGSVDLTAAACRSAGIDAAFSLAPGPRSGADLTRGVRPLLTETAAQVCGWFAAVSECSPRPTA